MLTGTLPWYVARGSGLTAWVLLSGSVVLPVGTILLDRYVHFSPLDVLVRSRPARARRIALTSLAFSPLPRGSARAYAQCTACSAPPTVHPLAADTDAASS